MFTMFHILLVLFVTNAYGAEKGEQCTVGSRTGICMEVSKCPIVIVDRFSEALTDVCQSASEVMLCCNDNMSSNLDDQCEPTPEYRTAKKTGKKAWDKCIDYQDLVYPCVGGVREDRCPYSADELLLQNTHTRRHEFPHLVLLGYTNDKKQLDWLCSGALVSERFVLTVAHCVSSRLNGPVTHVSLHPPDRADIEPDTIYRIQSVIRHPEYRAPRIYNDIALLELEQPVPLSSTVVPVCLVGAEPEQQNVIATTWNTHDILHTDITWLRKISLTKYPASECASLYPETKRGGYNDTTQVCYGDRTHAKDMCQDDGGAPLVVRHGSASCMYTAVGLASYGKGCFSHSPGVYTRVLPYLDWIESVVWP